MLNSNIFYRYPHNMVNFGPLPTEIGWRVWGIPANFNGFRVFASLLQRRRSLEANQTVLDVWLFPGVIHYVHLLGLLPSDGIFPGQNSLSVQVWHSPILAAILHGTRAAGVSQNLRHATRNGITELTQRAPPIFSWASITLGIGPHSMVTVISVSSAEVGFYGWIKCRARSLESE